MEIPDAVLRYLTGGHAALISTITEDGTPYGSVAGSTVALPDGRLRFAAWGGARHSRASGGPVSPVWSRSATTACGRYADRRRYSSR